MQHFRIQFNKWKHKQHNQQNASRKHRIEFQTKVIQILLKVQRCTMSKYQFFMKLYSILIQKIQLMKGRQQKYKFILYSWVINQLVKIVIVYQQINIYWVIGGISLIISQAYLMFKTGNMKYKNLGKCGLQVSVLGFGNMINYRPQNYEEDTKIIKKCLESGINFFDTAELYGNGSAESTLGKQFKQLGVDRENIVVSTKIWVAPNPDINSTHTNNRKHIKQAINASLARLQMDYVDIIFAHAFDQLTSMEEICRGFHQVIEEGKSFYWATSNWNAEWVFEAFALCEKLNLHKPVAAQNQYNMFRRDEMQVEYLTLFKQYGYGSTIWSPLAGGFLTGKYLNGIPQDQVTRFTDDTGFSAQIMKKFFYTPYNNQEKTNVLQELKKIAELHGFGLNHLALAWAIKYQYTSTALIGARTLSQLEDNLKALELLPKMNQLQPQINKIIGTTPITKYQFTKWIPLPPIRP